MRLTLLAILTASIGWAQLDSNTITATISRDLSVQADAVSITVSVTSPLNTSLDDVVAALQGSGITAANFAGVYVNTQQQLPMLTWNFGLLVPIAKLKDAVTALTGLQKNVAQNNKNLAVNFVVSGTQVSAQLQQMQTCPLPDLIADARTKAQQIANAAGLVLGQILSLSSSTSSSAPAVTNTGSGLGALLLSPDTYSFSPVCFVSVKFGVTRF